VLGSRAAGVIPSSTVPTHCVGGTGRGTRHWNPASYYTVTVFSTVGFGDITAKTELARTLVTVQMLVNLVVIGLVAKVIFGAEWMTKGLMIVEPTPWSQRWAASSSGLSLFIQVLVRTWRRYPRAWRRHDREQRRSDRLRSNGCGCRSVAMCARPACRLWDGLSLIELGALDWLRTDAMCATGACGAMPPFINDPMVVHRPTGIDSC
jgi:hypothetical protein